MAKKLRQQFQYGLKPGDLVISGEIQVSSNTPVALTLPDVKHGLKSASRTGTGAITVNLDDKFLGLSGFAASLEGTSNDGYMVKMAGEWVAGVDTVNEDEGVADGYLKLKVVDDAGTAADPLGHNIWLTVRLKTSEQG